MSILIDALLQLPTAWALTPVRGNKAAYLPNWQNHPASRADIARDIKAGKAKGFGILTGMLSAGILAIDCDGHQPHALLIEILGGEIPHTVAFTSGKEGRAQYLFTVPPADWDRIKTQKAGNANDGGMLEFRWDGCQSVLPPSAHPETKMYKWVNSPTTTEIAPIPEKVLDYLIVKPSSPPPNKPKPTHTQLELNIPPIPLERCLSKLHRDALSGVSDGNRHDTGVSLAKDLIGTAAKLDQLGESYNGDPRSFFDDYCARCSPPLPDKEGESIWKSIKGVPSPSINDDTAFKNCIDKWKREYIKSYQQISRAAGNGSSTGVEGADKLSALYQQLISTYQQLSADEIKQCIQEIEREYTKSYQQISRAAENGSSTGVEGADKLSALYQQLISTYQQLSADEIKRCLQEIEREYTKSYQQISRAAENGSSKGVEGADKLSALYQPLISTYQQLSADGVKQQVQGIISRNLAPVDRQAELVALSRRLGVSKFSLDGLADELERASSASADKAEMDKILIAQRHQLSPHQILPANLANKIDQISNARGTNPEPSILGLLAAASSVPHAETRLEVRNYGDVLSVYPNLFGMVVGDSSMLKSPTIKTTYIKPLKALRKIFIEQYKTKLDQYTRELSEWEGLDKKERGPEPKSPMLTVVSAVDTTIEKLEELALNQPHICPALFRDEVIGIFQSFDKHGGKGTNDGLSKLLSYYDGQPIDRHRMGTGSQLSDHDFHPSVFGGIQPEVLKKLAVGIGMDDAGTLCRFLYAPISRTYKDWDEEPDRELIDVSVFDRLICKINQLPPLVCSLDREGQKAWAKVANRYNKACLNNPTISQWLKHSYSKAIGQLGKIALTLHLIECATADTLSAVISAATIERAAVALDYFISQAISLIASTEETLEAHLVRILDKAKKLGSIKPREVQTLFSGKKRIDSATARSYLEQLSKSGYGVVDETGTFTPKNVESAPSASADNADKVLISYQQPESSLDNSLNNSADNADNILQSNLSENRKQENGLNTKNSTNGNGQSTQVSTNGKTISTISTDSRTHTETGVESADNLSADYQQVISTSITIDARVRHADRFNVRGGDIGTVEQINGERYLVRWESDKNNQIADAFRTFSADELILIPDDDLN
jgi:Protein of unknown function (DUF3987)/Bifunctional DNA primase/polymerase, N-terminal